MATTTTISVIKGDGIGPEIMAASLRVLEALDCGLDFEFVEAGLVAYAAQWPVAFKQRRASARADFAPFMTVVMILRKSQRYLANRGLRQAGSSVGGAVGQTVVFR